MTETTRKRGYGNRYRQSSIGLPDDLRRQVMFITASRNETLADFTRRALAAEVSKHAGLFPARRALDGADA